MPSSVLRGGTPHRAFHPFQHSAYDAEEMGGIIPVGLMGKQSPIPQFAEVTQWPVGHSNHHLPIYTHSSSFPADVQSSLLCNWINTCCYFQGWHEALLKIGFTVRRTRDGVGELSRQLPSLSRNWATSPSSRLQQSISTTGLGLVLGTDTPGLEETAPFT